MSLINRSADRGRNGLQGPSSLHGGRSSPSRLRWFNLSSLYAPERKATGLSFNVRGLNTTSRKEKQRKTMHYPIHVLASLTALSSVALAVTLADPTLMINGISFATRAHWMRRANEALGGISGSPCPFAAFGTVIVNHTDSNTGKLICMGVNENGNTGNPSLHGEMAAINNCTAILTDPHGDFRLTASEAQDAFADLTLYTNAESCPMCASAIRWSGFREYVYGTSIATLVQKGWGQIRIASVDVFEASFDLPSQARLMGNVLTNETDPYFLWQYDPSYPCPNGCARTKSGTSCTASAS
ncbi:guanine deaminase [Penicillium hispanicum]|uniref:guanine deaminase n=1 Tax=Penicillium hispanicum TaxID=1080232 RepID=UPI0025405D15|nr:guanine deaminase [Penicillium hispanicum]KAJ5587175.1 guanine deaminase [Penicillium hispanicum]